MSATAPAAVVYGHLHIPRTTWEDGVRFEEVSLGYPSRVARPGGPPSFRQILPYGAPRDALPRRVLRAARRGAAGPGDRRRRGRLASLAGLAVESTVDCPANPTYLALSPDRRFLYASHELDEGLLSAFALEADGAAARWIGSRPSGGTLPCHLSVHPSGRFVLTAHWGSGELAVHPVAADGSLGEACHVVPTGKAAAHMIRCDPTGRWVHRQVAGQRAAAGPRADPARRGAVGFERERARRLVLRG